MSLEKFLDPNNKRYQIQVVAPTYTYGTMYGLNSKYDFEIDFDEYDTSVDWEFNILVNGKVIATFSTIEDTSDYIKSLS